MNEKIQIYQVDAFTRHRFRGNPAGVVPNAEGLTEADMQDIARELNNSETAFVFPPQGKDHDIYVRFFTPTMEIPLCGHATIALHYVRSIEQQLLTTTVRQKSRAGILPIEIIRANDDYRIVMTQGTPQFRDIIQGLEKQALLEALKLEEADLDSRCPIQIVSTGHPKVIIGIKRRQTLHALEPDQWALKNVGDHIHCNDGYFIFTLDSNDPEILTHARMFAPGIGISEDPVTGMGNGPLGAYLIHHQLVDHNGKQFSFQSQQGEAMRRTGIVQVSVGIENNEPVSVKVAGEAVIIFQGEFAW